MLQILAANEILVRSHFSGLYVIVGKILIEIKMRYNLEKTCCYGVHLKFPAQHSFCWHKYCLFIKHLRMQILWH